MEKAEGFVTRAKDLEVYKRAYTVSLEIHRATLMFPKMEQYALANQLRRSSKGICANLAEGFAKQTHSKLEFARFLSIALGSCSETETWIAYAYDLGYIESQQLNSWLQHYAAIFSMLIKLREKLT